MLRTILSFFALCGMTSAAAATTLYSINWLSDPQPCAAAIASPLQGPIISSYYSKCIFNDATTLLSICPRQTAHATNLGLPWDRGDPITIVGYHVSIILTAPDAKAIVELGTASKFTGADVFATVSGTGTFTGKEWFPPGMEVPTGGDGARIDVYASCGGGGTYSILVTIFYTIPEPH